MQLRSHKVISDLFFSIFTADNSRTGNAFAFGGPQPAATQTNGTSSFTFGANTNSNPSPEQSRAGSPFAPNAFQFGAAASPGPATFTFTGSAPSTPTGAIPPFGSAVSGGFGSQSPSTAFQFGAPSGSGTASPLGGQATLFSIGAGGETSGSPTKGRPVSHKHDMFALF